MTGPATRLSHKWSQLPFVNFPPVVCASEEIIRAEVEHLLHAEQPKPSPKRYVMDYHGQYKKRFPHDAAT